VEPTRPLDHQIERRDVGYEDVEVEVETLFDDLRGDKDGKGGADALTFRGAELLKALAFDPLAIAQKEPRVK
jgi:hypothetical protein